MEVPAKVIKIGVSEPFCIETASSCVASDIARSYDPMAKLAREVVDVTLRFVYYKLEDQLVSAVQQGEVDGAIAKAWTVLRAYRLADSSCDRLCDLPFPDGDPRLSGVFISSAEGPVHSMEDVAGKRLAIGRPESYENSYAVERALGKLGILPQSKQEYGGCIPAAVSVLDGDAEVAVVSSYCTRYGLDEIIGKPGAFRILGETTAIPFVTFALSVRVPAEIRHRLKALLLQSSAAADLFPGGVRAPIDWDPEELRRV